MTEQREEVPLAAHGLSEINHQVRSIGTDRFNLTEFLLDGVASIQSSSVKDNPQIKKLLLEVGEALRPEIIARASVSIDTFRKRGLSADVRREIEALRAVGADQFPELQSLFVFEETEPQFPPLPQNRERPPLQHQPLAAVTPTPPPAEAQVSQPEKIDDWERLRQMAERAEAVLARGTHPDLTKTSGFAKLPLAEQRQLNDYLRQLGELERTRVNLQHSLAESPLSPATEQEIQERLAVIKAKEEELRIRREEVEERAEEVLQAEDQIAEIRPDLEEEHLTNTQLNSQRVRTETASNPRREADLEARLGKDRRERYSQGLDVDIPDTPVEGEPINEPLDLGEAGEMPEDKTPTGQLDADLRRLNSTYDPDSTGYPSLIDRYRTRDNLLHALGGVLIEHERELTAEEVEQLIRRCLVDPANRIDLADRLYSDLHLSSLKWGPILLELGDKFREESKI